MDFCNKGVVQATHTPPGCGQRPHFYIFFYPSLIYMAGESPMLDYDCPKKP